MTDPIRQIAHPIRPSGPNSSFKNIAASTALKSDSSRVRVPYQHTERTQWRDQNCRRKGICSEIGYFADNHCSSAPSNEDPDLLPSPPTRWGSACSRSYPRRIHVAQKHRSDPTRSTSTSPAPEPSLLSQNSSLT
jgi:hypothetical protein